MTMSDAAFANEMIGRTLIDPAGTTYVVVDFRFSARHGALDGQLMELVGGEPTGVVREIDSIAGWMVGNRICTCQVILHLGRSFQRDPCAASPSGTT